jgi:hypothetical protein
MVGICREKSTLIKEEGQYKQVSYFSIYGTFGWKKKLLFYDLVIHICVQ